MNPASPHPVASSRRRPVSRRRPGRPAAAGQIALLAGLYLIYSASRLAAADDLIAARARAAFILTWESRLSLDVEAGLNHVVTNVEWLAVPATYWYATLHYLLTPAVLVWTYRRHPASYRRVRDTLLIATAIGLVMYLLIPTAPPRLMADGYLDTMAMYQHVGWWGGDASAPRGMAAVTNELAAMPSLHVGWAVWVAWVFRHAGVRRRWEVLAQQYAVVTTLVVLATGNHWLLDAAAGAAVVLIATVATRQSGSHRLPRYASSEAGAHAPRLTRPRRRHCYLRVRCRPSTALARPVPPHYTLWTGERCHECRPVRRRPSVPAQPPLPDRLLDQPRPHRLQPARRNRCRHIGS